MIFKKAKKDVPKLLTLGIGVGVGQSLISDVGGTADLSPLTSKVPAIAGVMGAGIVLDELGKLKKKLPKF